MKNLPLEKEVKFYLHNLAAFGDRLHRLGAVNIRQRTHELNYRFDDRSLSLTRVHKVLRLRKDDQVILTYKGPSQPNADLSIRTEIELIVDDFDAAAQFLEELGYTHVIRYEKWRAKYRLNILEISLDEMPYGNFVEIEGDDETAIPRTAAMLGLNWEYRINDSYLVIFERVKKKMNLPVENLTFEEFKNLSITPADLGVKPADALQIL